MLMHVSTILGLNFLRKVMILPEQYLWCYENFNGMPG